MESEIIDFQKSWTKMLINSSYGFPPVPFILYPYDENKASRITEEGIKNLEIIKQLLIWV